MADQEQEAVKVEEGQEAPAVVEAPAKAAEDTAAPPADEKSGVSVDKDVVLSRLRDILPTVDFQTTSEKMLRKQLEGEFGADLTDLKTDIRKAIEKFMDEQEPEEEEAEEEPPKKRKAGGGFGKRVKLGPALSAFLGVEEESRAQIVKKLWDYIKAHGLQDPKDKRRIVPDDALKKVFPKPVTMFSMNKELGNHILTEDGQPSSKSRKRKDSEEEDDDASDESLDSDDDGGKSRKGKGKAAPKSKAKKRKGGSSDEDDDDDDDSDDEYKAPKKKRAAPVKKAGAAPTGFQKPCKLSAELAKLVGVSEMSRPQLQKFFTGYFKENDLLDPSDKRRVLCNDVLKKLFEVDSFVAFGGIQKLLKPHLS